MHRLQSWQPHQHPLHETHKGNRNKKKWSTVCANSGRIHHLTKPIHPQASYMSQTNILILLKVIAFFSASKQCFLTLPNSVFNPHSVFRYFVSFSQYIVFTSLNTTNCIEAAMCSLSGRNWRWKGFT
jgi:hypothetical protein